MIKKFFYEFKEFALKGNMMSMAIGVLIGASFQGLITSFTDDIISPLLGIFANTNFDNLHLNVAGVDVAYGSFLTSAINFLIMTLIIFIFVRIMNRLTKYVKKDAVKALEAPERLCPRCLTAVNEKATRCPACTSEF